MRERSLVLLDLETGVETISVPESEGAHCPAWHPDGDRLLVSGLRVITVDGAATQLSTGGVSLIPSCGEFTADGAWVFFKARQSTDDAFSSRIWRIRPDGTDLDLVTPEFLDTRSLFSPSPDGTRVAYIVGSGLTYLVVRTIETARVDTVSPSVGAIQFTGFTSVAWSPAGDWIAYTRTSQDLALRVDRWTTRYGSYATLVRPDGSETRHPVPAGSAPHANGLLGGVTWSPDGAWLIGRHWRWLSDGPLLLIESATGVALPLHGGTREYVSPVWRP
jgi:Tol biopolymer transport system component